LSPAIDTPSPERDRFIASNLKDTRITLVARANTVEKNEFYKIFAVRGKSYKPVPQTEMIQKCISQLENELGKAESLGWSITNELTTLTLSFPEKVDEIRDMYPELTHSIRPIIRITTSDIGFSSFKVQAGFELGGSRVYREKSSVEESHDHQFEAEKFLKKVEKKIFPEFIAVPAELSRLIGIEVNTVEAIDEVFDFIKLESKPGFKSIAKHIKELMCLELSLGTCTAYDVVMSLITVPNRLVIKKSDGTEKEISDSSRKIMENVLAEAIFCPFDCSDTTYGLLPE
jgi:transcription antitermination factor NusG